MKKLRIFDSLKFVRAILAVVVVATFILNAAHADTAAIQLVIAYGKTEQSATPTPTTPVPIMTNNGELRVSRNLFNQNEVLAGYFSSAPGSEIQAYSVSRTFVIPCKPNTTYTFYFDNSMLTTPRCSISGFEEKPEIGGATIVQSLYKDNFSKIHNVTFTTDANVHYLALWLIYSSSHAGVQDALKTVVLREGTSADGIYTDGLTETIRDAAGHKATAEMLLSVGDYADEQNITTGAITRRVGVKVLNGTEDWRKGSTISDAMNGFTLYDDIGNANTHISYCTHYSNALDINSVGCYVGVRLNFILGASSSITTAEQFKQWLADQYAAGTPVIVLYPLATETTENVTAQSLTTAPVRQTMGAIMGMPIVTTLMDGTVIGDLIRVATTKYNEESFEDVQGALSGVFNTVDTVVTQTMTQAQAIDQIANEKQTRPDETCPVGKNCLLVEGEDGTPHWYVIAGADEASPTTNP